MPSGDNNRKLSDAQRDEAVRLYTTQLTDGTWMGVSTIARHFGVRHFVIQSILKKRGVKTRSAREAHSGGKRCKPIVKLPHGEPPECGCGCGELTEWNRPKNRWRATVIGHKARGENHWTWRGGNSRGYPPNWSDIARKMRRRDDYTCRSCGLKQRSPSLHVHHLDWDPSNCDPANLVTLCNPCHSRHHLKGMPLAI